MPGSPRDEDELNILDYFVSEGIIPLPFFSDDLNETFFSYSKLKNLYILGIAPIEINIKSDFELLNTNHHPLNSFNVRGIFPFFKHDISHAHFTQEFVYKSFELNTLNNCRIFLDDLNKIETNKTASTRTLFFMLHELSDFDNENYVKNVLKDLSHLKFDELHEFSLEVVLGKQKQFSFSKLLGTDKNQQEESCRYLFKSNSIDYSLFNITSDFPKLKISTSEGKTSEYYVKSMVDGFMSRLSFICKSLYKQEDFNQSNSQIKPEDVPCVKNINAIFEYSFVEKVFNQMEDIFFELERIGHEMKSL